MAIAVMLIGPLHTTFAHEISQLVAVCGAVVNLYLCRMCLPPTIHLNCNSNVTVTP